MATGLTSAAGLFRWGCSDGVAVLLRLTLACGRGGGAAPARCFERAAERRAGSLAAATGLGGACCHGASRRLHLAGPFATGLAPAIYAAFPCLACFYSARREESPVFASSSADSKPDATALELIHQVPDGCCRDGHGNDWLGGYYMFRLAVGYGVA